MAKRKRSVRTKTTKRKQTPYNRCIKKEFGERKAKLLRGKSNKKMTQPQVRRIFKESINVCKRK